jgi:hypothetical protein
MAAEFDKVIAALTRRQHGHVTRGQLLALGLGEDAIDYRLKVRRLIPVHAGVYAVGHVSATPVARAAAAVLACGEGAALSHGSAASLWGFFNRWGESYEVIATSARRRPGIRVHRSATVTRRDLTRQLGIRVTTPARTVLDISPRLTDKRLTRVVNDACHARQLNLSDLAEVLTRNPFHPGAKRLTPFVKAPRGMTRSELEDAFVAFAQRYGLPAPAINTHVNGHEADALFEHERVIVEIDSWEFHRDRTSFESDRNRDAELLAAGFQTVRVTDERLKESPESEARRLHSILAARRAA